MISISREFGKLLIFNLIGFYFSKEPELNPKFFLEFLTGRKSVNNINLNTSNYYHLEGREDTILIIL